MSRIGCPIASMCRPFNNERGQALALVGMGIGTTALLALAVVAVDVGRLALTATEVQTLADTAATAAARALMDGGTPATVANTVAGANRVDGQSAVVPCGSPPCANLVTGSIDSNTYAFTPGGPPFSAVRATAQATVNNLLAPMLGDSTSTVTKTATAAFVTIGSGTPGLPFAVGECAFTPGCTTGVCLPPLTQAPSTTDNTAWSGFFGGTGQSDIQAFMPSPCGTGTNTVPNLSVNDSINLTNGQLTPVLQAVRCMVCTLGITTFLAPVVSCTGNFNQSSSVVGFTTIVIDSFTKNGHTVACNGNGSIDGINLHEIFNDAVPGRTGGCTECGTGFITLVG